MAAFNLLFFSLLLSLSASASNSLTFTSKLRERSPTCPYETVDGINVMDLSRQIRSSAGLIDMVECLEKKNVEIHYLNLHDCAGAGRRYDDEPGNEGNNLTEGLIKIVNSSSFKNLKILDLSRTRLNYSALHALSASPIVLHYLNLSGNKISKDMLDLLLTAQAFSELRKIRLNGTGPGLHYSDIEKRLEKSFPLLEDKDHFAAGF